MFSVNKNKKTLKNIQLAIFLFCLFLSSTPFSLSAQLLPSSGITDIFNKSNFYEDPIGTTFPDPTTGLPPGSEAGIPQDAAGNPLYPAATGGTEDPAVDKLNQRAEEDTKAITQAIDETQKLQKKDEEECAARQKGNQNNPSNPNNSQNGTNQTEDGNIADDGSVNNPNLPGNPRDYNDPANPAYQIDPVTGQISRSDQAYITANEGIVKVPYVDPTGNNVVGIGHLITGNEDPDIAAAINTRTPLSDEQVQRLYNTDYAGARAGTINAARQNGVDWNSLDPARQTALTDMTFSMGEGGINNFDQMWAGVRTGNWQQASYQVLHSDNGGISPYASQTGKRARNNAQILLNGTNPGSLVYNKLNDKNYLANFWQSTSNNIAKFFGTDKIAEALTPKTAEASIVGIDFGILSGLTSGGLTDLLSGMNQGDLISLVQSLTGSQFSSVLSRVSGSGSGSGAVSGILKKIPGSVLGGSLSQMNSGQLSGLLGGMGSGDMTSILGNIPKTGLGNVLNQMDGNALSSILGKVSPDTAGSLLQYIPSDNFGDILNKLPTGTLSSLTNGMSSDLLGSLFGNASGNSIGSALSKLTGGALDGVLGNVPSDMIGGVLGKVPQSSLDGILGSLSNPSSILGGMDPASLGNLLGGMSPEALGDLATKPGIAQLITTTPNATALVSEIPDIASDPALSGLNQTLGQDVSDGLGGVAGAITGLMFVPVREVDGKLMTASQNTDKNTKNIDKTTKDIKDLDIQICTHLKAIRRIQQRFELKQMVQDFDTKVYRSTILANYTNEMLGEKGLIQTGYTDTKGQEGPLFVVNINNYMQDSRDEATDLLLTALKESKDDTEITKEIVKTLEKDRQEDPLTPTVTAEMLAKLDENNTQSAGMKSAYTDLPILSWITKPLARLFGNESYAAATQPTNKLSSEERGKIWLAMLEPKNNRYGNYLLAKEQLTYSQNVAESNAMMIANWGQGFKDIRKCEEWIGEEPNKVCKTWNTNTPSSIVKDSAGGATNIKLDQQINATDEKGANIKDKPTAKDVLNFRPDVGPGGPTGPAIKPKVDEGTERKDAGAETPASISQDISGTDPDAGTGGGGSGGTGGDGGTTGGGSNTSGLDMSQFTQMFNGLLNSNQGSLGQSTESLLAILRPLIDALIKLFNDTVSNQNKKPEIYFNQISPSVNSIQSGTTNKTTVIWASPNATDCKAKNNWLSGNTVTKNAGESLGKSGLLKIDLPLTVIGAKITKTRSGVATDIIAVKTNDSKLTTESLSFPILTADVAIGDVFALTVGSKSVSYTAKTVSSNEVISGLLAQTFITFSGYTFTREGTNLVVYANTDYYLTCTNDKGSTDKSISIKR